MILKLYDRAWDDILEGLDLLAEYRMGYDKPDNAKFVREFIKTLKELSEERIGGKIEGYRLNAKVGERRLVLELRVMDESGVAVSE